MREETLPPLADALKGTFCFNFLLQHNKLPQAESLKITPLYSIYYLTVSIDQV